MPITLVIVESPAKCKKIESYLGTGYKVIASFGHLRNISGLEAINVNDNFATTYSIIQENLKLKQIEKIRSEIAKSDEVVIATDDDREGEAIGWHICELFELSIYTTKRIIFHEITESAIQRAISYPKQINMTLVHAQQARQILDLLVGFTISPILWKSVSNTGLSAGRCQTPALRIIYENYLDIKQSPGKLVYNTIGYFTSLNLLFHLNKQFEQESHITHFLEQCKTWEFLYSTTSPKKTIKKSPEPLTTSTLLQLASNELNISPKDTMKYVQQLYECGYITYMRTDSKKYCQEFIEKAKQFIKKMYGEKYVSNTIDTLIVGTNKELTQTKGIQPQEAHEAIRPVNIHIHSLDTNEHLLAKAIRLYELIWSKTLESCMTSAQYNSIKAKITAPLESEFVYKTEQPIFLGWQIVSKKNHRQNSNQSDETDINHYQYIQTLKQNVSMKSKKIESTFTLNELKSHYTEARLVQLLEEKGIGRPSTFASLVDKIQERKYVEKQTIVGKKICCKDFLLIDNIISEVTSTREFGNEKNKLVIQSLGIIVIEFLLQNFDMFFNYEYTKQMEECLDKIAHGESIWYDLCNNCYKELTDVTDKLKDEKKFALKIDKDHTLIMGKYGPVVKYIDPTNSKNVQFLPVKKNIDIDSLKMEPKITLDGILETTKKSIGKYKGHDLFIKNGKYGVYAQWGNETKSLKEEFGGLKIETVPYIDIIRCLDRDNLLDPTKPVGLIRELTKHISIRTGKYGDYIFYKKPRAKNPSFFKLDKFNHDYKKCDKTCVLNWIKQTYNIE